MCPELLNIVLVYLGEEFLLSAGKVLEKDANALVFDVKLQEKTGQLWNKKGEPTIIPIPRSGIAPMHFMKENVSSPIKKGSKELFNLRVLTY
mmetsp:Transcript_1909/g.3698  ORF Transcript_1909/g.3698 Transcript_1909/m.3698 type:complete len:92 (+) Transcript_1909:660-935(+)